MISPIALFAFNRPHHLLCTLTSLAQNALAVQSCLIIFCDGPHTDEEKKRRMLCALWRVVLLDSRLLEL